MKEFSLQEMNFIRRHWQIDMSAYQMARYFGCPESDIHAIRKAMGLKYNLKQLTAFCTPFPFQVGKNVKKFSWPLHGNAYGEAQET